jgi:hypothetical protein
MQDLQARASRCNARPITRNEQESGSSPLVGSLIFLGFAGKFRVNSEGQVSLATAPDANVMLTR